jgi:oligoendopeptidase F
MEILSQAIEKWDDVASVFEELVHRSIHSSDELRTWLLNRSELEAVLQEDLGWRYIKHTCDTANEAKHESLNRFIQDIEPHLAEYNDVLNKKLLACGHLESLQSPGYAVYLRTVRKEVEMFREENIPLLTEIQQISNEYGQISGAMTVEVNGKTSTMQQAAVELKSTDREHRKAVYLKMNARRLEAVPQLNALFDKLFTLRNQLALNAGYANFRDYMFDSLGRFDYTPQHCFDFHASIAKHIVPLINRFDTKRKSALGYDALKPWDMDVDPEQLLPLKPYADAPELIAKTKELFASIRPAFGEVIDTMEKRGHFDLDSRIGKAPGGYNYPLYKSSLPFIFMNSAGTLRDMVTMMHEGGHAIHSWLSKELEITPFKSTPSEIAEVASMAMELISMEHWDSFFGNEKDLVRAKKYQLEKILSILPWIAIVDAFQHWIYVNPKHTPEERSAKWQTLLQEFGSEVVDKSDYPEFEHYSWHKQLHIFEVPFYYIEYGIAQLASIAIWKRYKENPQETIDAYCRALEAGYTLTLPKLYELAGIRFDFSDNYVREIAEFVKAEYDCLG